MPTICEYGISGNAFDFHKYDKECSKQSNVFNRKQLTTSRDKEDVTLVGYPRVEYIPNKALMSSYEFNNYVVSNIIDMDDPQVPDSIKENIEFKLDISDSKASKLHYQLKRNETRAQEQKKLREEIIDKEKLDGTYDTRIDKNVLIFYIDNLSRAHFFRKLPKLAKWLEQFMDNETENLKAYQFFRYYSAYYNTRPTNAALYYGEITEVNDTSQNVFNSYAENGYITGFFKDSCEASATDYTNYRMEGFNWDHRGTSLT